MSAVRKTFYFLLNVAWFTSLLMTHESNFVQSWLAKTAEMLYDIQAVQTLSRLNRCHPKKYDTCILDFANKPEIIQESFSRYYRTTILSGETDPNKLHDLVYTMESHQVYSQEDIENEVSLYLDGADRDKLDYILDMCTDTYEQLETEGQVEFKSAAKSFCRTYSFLGAILPYGNAKWEKLSIFLNLLIPKLPSPKEDDFSRGILETIDLDSYRNEARECMCIKLEDEDAEIAPVPAGKTGRIIAPEMERLSVIITEFNDMFGNIDWKEPDNAHIKIIHHLKSGYRIWCLILHTIKQASHMKIRLMLHQRVKVLNMKCPDLLPGWFLRQAQERFERLIEDMSIGLPYLKKSL